MSTRASFTFRKGNLIKLLFIPAYVVGWLLSWIIPRRKNSWVFGSGAGLAEGALRLAHVVQERDPSAKVTWLATSTAECERARELGFTAEMKSSLAGFWETLRSQYLIVTHGLGDVQRFGVFRATVVNLWHGPPIKKLHLDSNVTTELRGGRLQSILARMYRFGAGQVNLYVAGSPIAAERLRSAFRVLPGRVRVLGDARLDPLIAALNNTQNVAEHRTTIAELCDLDASQRALTWVLYAPTWRDGAANPAIPTAEETQNIQEWAERQGVLLFIRSHPLGQGDYTHVLSDRVVSLPADLLEEITPELGAFDSVITDYSSLALDFTITGRPVLWFAPDLDEYESRRGLYEPYAITTEGHYSTTWQELLERAVALLDQGSGAHRAARLRTARLAERFHAYVHGDSATRVLEYLEQISQPGCGYDTTQAVFFESFYGRFATCNPSALDREIASRCPLIDRFWSVESESVTVPEGATPLLIGSPEWYAVRRAVPLVIVNDWLRLGFRRRRGQFVLQTWHGTPLKRLALDRAGQSLRTRLAVVRESKRWSAMLAQNPEAAEMLARSYRFGGEMLVTGYPRNDRLANAAHDGERLSSTQLTARHRLNLTPDRNVLLYAPTWRDSRRNATVDTLDVETLGEMLGDGWIILARGHSRDAPFAQYSGAQVIDVTRHPEVNDLIVAADVFVTDYSSLMFDVSVAGVPTILYVADLDEYREHERGFTFDIETHSPGPLVTETSQVAELLADVEARGSAAAWVQDSLEMRTTWRNRWNHLEDGLSAHRVVTWLEEHGKLP